MIEFQCTCGQRVRMAANFAGRRCRCKACGASLLIPSPEQAAPVAAVATGEPWAVSAPVPAAAYVAGPPMPPQAPAVVSYRSMPAEPSPGDVYAQSFDALPPPPNLGAPFPPFKPRWTLRLTIGIGYGVAIGLLLGAIIAGVNEWLDRAPTVTAGPVYTLLLAMAAAGAAIGAGIAYALARLARRRHLDQARHAAYQPAIPHDLMPMPPALLALATLFTSGAFGVIWLAAIHGRLRKVRHDDPSGGAAIGFLFIPFYNLYWFFFVNLRLCTRLEEACNYAKMPRRMPRGPLITMMILRLLFLLDALNLILLPWLVYKTQCHVNDLIVRTRGSLEVAPHARGRRTGAMITASIFPGIFLLAFLTLGGLLLHNLPTYPVATMAISGADDVIAASPDLQTVVTAYVGYDNRGAEGTVTVWRFGQAQPLLQLPKHSSVTPVVSADGKRIALLRATDVTILDETGKSIAAVSYRNPGWASVRGRIVGDELHVTGIAPAVQIFNLSTGQRREGTEDVAPDYTGDGRYYGGYTDRHTVSRDNRVEATSTRSDGFYGSYSVRIRERPSGRERARVSIENVRGLSLSADGSKLYVAQWEDGLSVWDTQTGAQIGRYPKLSAGEHFAVSDDGKRLLASHYGHLAIYELD